MNQITTTQKQTLLEALLPNGTDAYVALLTTLPVDYDGAGLVELAKSWYARKACSSWVSAASSGVAYRKNVGAVVFDTADEDTEFVGWALYDAATSGNLIAAGPILDVDGEEDAVDLAAGDVFQFQALQLQVKL